jgi:hypothetical protein
MNSVREYGIHYDGTAAAGLNGGFYTPSLYYCPEIYLDPPLYRGF